eukprot:101142-Hanusia_phi.AAC.1
MPFCGLIAGVERASFKAVMGVAGMQLLIFVSLLLPLVRLVGAAAFWLIEDDEVEAMALARELSMDGVRRVIPESDCSVGGFDKRKMLQPHFGQTFKFKRVGVK